MDHLYREFEAKHLDWTTLVNDEDIRKEISDSLASLVDVTKKAPGMALSAITKPIILTRDIITYRRELREIFQGLGLQGKKAVLTRACNLSPFGTGSFKMLTESLRGKQRLSRVPVKFDTVGGKAHASSGVLGFSGNLLAWTTLYQLYCETGEFSRPEWDQGLAVVTGLILGKMGRSGHLTSLYQEFKDWPLSVTHAAELYREKHGEDPTYVYEKLYHEYKDFLAYRNKMLGLEDDQSPLSIEGFKKVFFSNNKAAQTLGMDITPGLAGIKQLIQSATGTERLTKRDLGPSGRRQQLVTGTARSLAYVMGFLTSIQATKDGLDAESAGGGAFTFAFWLVGQMSFVNHHLSRKKQEKKEQSDEAQTSLDQ